MQPPYDSRYGTPPPQHGGFPPQAPQGGGGFPPQGPGFPPQGPGYPPQGPGGGFPPQGGGFPPQGGGFPPQGGGYPPQGGGFPPQGPGGGFPPQGGGYPPQGGGPQQMTQQAAAQLAGAIAGAQPSGENLPTLPPGRHRVEIEQLVLYTSQQGNELFRADVIVHESSDYAFPPGTRAKYLQSLTGRSRNPGLSALKTFLLVCCGYEKPTPEQEALLSPQQILLAVSPEQPFKGTQLWCEGSAKVSQAGKDITVYHWTKVDLEALKQPWAQQAPQNTQGVPWAPPAQSPQAPPWAQQGTQGAPGAGAWAPANGVPPGPPGGFQPPGGGFAPPNYPGPAQAAPAGSPVPAFGAGGGAPVPWGSTR